MKLFDWIFGTNKEKPVSFTRYDAAQHTGENRRHWAFVDSLSADSSMTLDVRKELRERSRYEVANNSYALGVLLTLAGDTIGTGPRLQLMTGEDFFNTTIERNFSAWAQEIKLGEKLRTMRLAKAVDGEAFALFVNNERLKNDVKLDLNLIESDRVTSPITDLDWKKFVDGIELDRNGNPVKYSILKSHPGDLSGPLQEYEDVDAENVVHWYRADRPEQHRGIPELTSCLNLFGDLRRYTLAVLASAETAADFAAVIYTDTPAGGESVSAKPFETVQLEKRMATTLPDGWKLGQLKSEQPTTNYGDFKREILGEIGRSLQIPINVMTGDSSRHNYASGRLDHQIYYRAIRIEQEHCASVVLNKLFETWYKEYSVQKGSPYLELENPAQYIRWFWDGFEHVDPSKEASAQEKRLKNYTTTLAAEYAKTGKDWEVELQQIAKEARLKKELDL